MKEALLCLRLGQKIHCQAKHMEFMEYSRQYLAGSTHLVKLVYLSTDLSFNHFSMISNSRGIRSYLSMQSCGRPNHEAFSLKKICSLAFRRADLLSSIELAVLEKRSIRRSNRSPFLPPRYTSRDQEEYSASELKILANSPRPGMDLIQFCDICNNDSCSSHQS